MANVNTNTEEIFPQGGADNAGRKLGFLPVTAKAAQNDTITVLNARQIVHAELRIVATGAAEPYTMSGNVLTLTSATTGSVRGTIYYR